jgi:UDP-glucose 4-epimerase
MNSDKNILVTGGAGYIGTHTVVELMNRGYDPIIVDDFRNSDRAVLNGVEKITGKRPQLIELDISVKSELSNVFERHEFVGVIHFAALKAVGESVEDPMLYYRNNLIGLINVVELSIEQNVTNFVFSSSCTVYGEPKDSKVVDESTPTQEANSPYGSTKQMCERILEDVSRSGSSMRILSLRYFNPVGAHNSGLIGELPLGKPNNLLPYVTQTGIGKLPELTVNGNDYNTADGTCVRDYIHVMDLADAHIKGLEWLETQSPCYEVVNVGTGKGVSILEIINTFEEVSGVKLNWSFGPRRPGDVEQIYANTSKAEEVLGWKSMRTIEDAIRDAWKWENYWNENE